MKNNSEFCLEFLIHQPEKDQIIVDITRALNFGFSVPTLLLNGCIIFVILRNRQLYSTYNFFVLNMCLACLLVGTVNQIIVGFNLNPKHCWIFKLSLLILTLLPFSTLCLILYERYLKIFHPLHYHNYLTSKVSAILIFLTWIIPVAVKFITRELGKVPELRKIRLALKLQAGIHITGIIWISFVNMRTMLLVQNIQREIMRQKNRFTGVKAFAGKDVNKAVWFTTVCIATVIVSYLPFCVFVFFPLSAISYYRRLYTRYIVLSLMNFSADIIPLYVIGFHKDIRSQLIDCFKFKLLLRLRNTREDGAQVFIN